MILLNNCIEIKRKWDVDLGFSFTRLLFGISVGISLLA
jgi:hypothetical protein